MFFGRNDAKAETPVLWPTHAKSWLIGKDSDAGRDWGQEEKGTTEDEMAGWHHWLDDVSEWTPGDGDGQGGLACCDSWGRRESNTTERLNWTEVWPWASLVAQPVSNPPAMWETWVPSLGWEDPIWEGNRYPLQYSGLEKAMDWNGVTMSQTWLSDFHSMWTCMPAKLLQLCPTLYNTMDYSLPGSSF